MNDAATSQLPISLTFSRLGASSSSIFYCEPRWLNTIRDNSNPSLSGTSWPSDHPQTSPTLRKWNKSSATHTPLGTAVQTPLHRMPFRNENGNDNAFESLGAPCSLHDRAYTKFNEYPTHCATHRFPISNGLLSDAIATGHTFHQDISRLLPSITLGSKPGSSSALIH